MILCDSIKMQCFDDLSICFEDNIAAFYSEFLNSKAFFFPPKCQDFIHRYSSDFCNNLMRP